MSEDLKSRIFEYQKNLFERTGVETKFSEVVRSLIEKGLKAE